MENNLSKKKKKDFQGKEGHYEYTLFFIFFYLSFQISFFAYNTEGGWAFLVGELGAIFKLLKGCLECMMWALRKCI